MRRLCVSNLLMNILIKIRTVTLWQLQKLGSVRNVSRLTIRASRKSKVNSRHAAALALVVWYLMVPPLSADHHQVNYTAPFAAWITFGKYASQEKCEQMRGGGEIPSVAGVASEAEQRLRCSRGGIASRSATTRYTSALTAIPT